MLLHFDFKLKKFNYNLQSEWTAQWKTFLLVFGGIIAEYQLIFGLVKICRWVNCTMTVRGQASVIVSHVKNKESKVTNIIHPCIF